MHDLGIHSGADLKEQSLEFLVRQFGKVGKYYYKIARAQDDRAVEPNRIRKSIGAENSFAEDLSDKATILQELEQIAQTLQERLEKHQASGRTLTLKVKFSDYQQITRSKTLLTPISELNEIITQAISPLGIAVRLAASQASHYLKQLSWEIEILDFWGFRYLTSIFAFIRKDASNSSNNCSNYLCLNNYYFSLFI